MNKINCLKNVVVLAGICILCSCHSYEYQKVTIAIDDACTVEQQSVAYEVINKRIASIWSIKEKTDLIDGKFDLIYSGENSLLTQILIQKGEIYISEMYSNFEIQSPLNKVYERLFWLMENTDHQPLWDLKSLRSGYLVEIPELISVPLQQVAYIDSIFNSYKHFFPANITFAWTAKSREGFYDLLALKSTPPSFALNLNSVKFCTVENYEYNDGESSLNYQEMRIVLEKDFCDEWARMTRNNIGKNLAIVMDGKVLMYPRVHSEITGGNLSITGNYENNEMLLIKSVILGGTLDCKAQIINQ
jgi:hypothetical protein